MIDDVRSGLRTVRAERRRRWPALALAGVGGIALATVHPLGLVVGGAAVGIVSKNVSRGVGAGLAFGVLVLALFVLVSIPGSPAAFVTLTPISYLTIAIGLVAPVVGSLIRGIV